MIHGIERKMRRNPTYPVGYGYIVLPHNVGRQDFVDSAYRKEKVSILPDQGCSYIHECYITKNALREIVFPDTVDNLGSAVVFVTNHFNNKPFVIGVLAKEDESDLFREYAYSISRVFEESKAMFDLNAQNGEVVINVTNISDAASILLNCIGETGTRITVNCNGDFFGTVDNNYTVQAGGNVNIMSTNAQETQQSIINLSNTIIDLLPHTRLNIGTGEEPIPKGTELVEQLNATNSYLSTLQSAIETALGTIDTIAGSVSQAPFSATMSTTNPGDYDDVNSEISFTD